MREYSIVVVVKTYKIIDNMNWCIVMLFWSLVSILLATAVRFVESPWAPPLDPLLFLQI